MKQLNKSFAVCILILCTIFSAQSVFAQKQVEVNGHDVGTWFADHWMWIAGGVILLLIIIFASGGGGRRKSTTVVKDINGNVKSVTTTEEI